MAIRAKSMKVAFVVALYSVVTQNHIACGFAISKVCCRSFVNEPTEQQIVRRSLSLNINLHQTSSSERELAAASKRPNKRTRSCRGLFPFGRLTVLGIVIVGSFFLYLAGTAILNRTIVDAFGVSRTGDAFAPFVTLLSLIYSIVLGQIYHYYFERQQAIQNCLYEEAASLQLLYSTYCQCMRTPSKLSLQAIEGLGHLVLSPLKAYAQNFVASAFSKRSSRILSHDDPGKLVEFAIALSELDDSTTVRSSSRPSSSSSLLVANAIQAATSARALRVSHVNSELPAVQKITARLLSYVILLGFVLVDLKAPILEALLFSVICGCFTTIHVFLADLSDPFSGQWTVGTHIRKDLDDLMVLMREDSGKN